MIRQSSCDPAMQGPWKADSEAKTSIKNPPAPQEPGQAQRNCTPLQE